MKEFFQQNPKAALGFSGGTDSAYLLYAAKECGADVQPYYVKTIFQPQFEYTDALALCEQLGISLKVIEHDILSEQCISENPANRCYYCKKLLFTLLKQRAEQDGYHLIIDGTNASDNSLERPGMKALEEMAVRSPLRECGLTKDKIRDLSHAAGLFTWDKPAYSCLATRIPTGDSITEDLLRRIEKAECALSKLGFSDFRVRVYHDFARVQVREEQFIFAAECREKICERLKPYFKTVFLDMTVR